MSISSSSDRNPVHYATPNTRTVASTFRPEEFAQRLERLLDATSEIKAENDGSRTERQDERRQDADARFDAARRDATMDDHAAARSREKSVRKEKTPGASRTVFMSDSRDAEWSPSGNMLDRVNPGESSHASQLRHTAGESTTAHASLRPHEREASNDPAVSVFPASHTSLAGTGASEDAAGIRVPLFPGQTSDGAHGFSVTHYADILPPSPVSASLETALRDVTRIATTGAVTIFSLRGKVPGEEKRESLKVRESSAESGSEKSENEVETVPTPETPRAHGPAPVRDAEAKSGTPGKNAPALSVSPGDSSFVRLLEPGRALKSLREQPGEQREGISSADGRGFDSVSPAAAILPFGASTSAPERGTDELSNQKTNEDLPTLDTTDRVAFVRRIAAAMQSAGNRDGLLRMRLHPESLGSIALRVRIKDGTISARLFAASGKSRDLLLQDIDALRENLERLGFTVGDLSVLTMNEENEGNEK